MNAVNDGMNLASSWEMVADHAGDRLALCHGEVKRNWTDFEARSSRLAGALKEAGIGAGDNVALGLFNGNEYLEAEFAAFKQRAAACNLNYRYVERELWYLVDNSNAKAVFYDSTLVDRFDSIVGDLPDVRLWIQVGDGERPDWAVSYEDVVAASSPAPRIERSGQDLWILYTGGTTGNPKGVMWPHDNLVTLTNRTLEPLGLTMPATPVEIPALLDALDGLGHTPRQLAAAPLMHGTAGIGALFCLFQGGSVVTLTNRSYDPVELLETVERERVTLVSLVGDVFCAPLVEALDESSAAGRSFDLSSLKVVTSSGVMWSQQVKDRLLAHGEAAGADLMLNDSLGASEGVGFAGKRSVDGGDTATATFTLGPNAAIFSEDGRRIHAGSEEAGLLAVTGPIPLGYYGDPVKTAETYKEFDGQRWSIPGDWATIAADGTVTLLGRGSVSINTGGEKVFPEEVEEALKVQPEVADALVVGVPDPTWGSAVSAVVQLAPGASITDGDLVDAMRSQLSGYKLPKNLIWVDQVVRGPNGKADYKWASTTARTSLGID